MKSKVVGAFRKLEDESEAFAQVSPIELEQGLSPIDEVARNVGGGSPYTVAALRSRLAAELTSTGGRPTRREAAIARRIPLTSTEWNTLEEITRAIREQGMGVTSGQVAGVLLNQAMSEVLTRISRTKKSEQKSARRLSQDRGFEDSLEFVLAAAASAEDQLEQLVPIARELLLRVRSGKPGVEQDDGE
jgi:hypothetical protein